MSLNYADIKAQCEILHSLPFELYKELITVYKTPKQVYVSSANSAYNFAYEEESPGLNLSYVTQSGQIYATIDFIDSDFANKLSWAGAGQNQIHSQVTEQSVKICIGTGDFHYFQKCEKIVIDNRNFRILTDYQGRGAISTRNQVILWATPIE